MDSEQFMQRAISLAQSADGYGGACSAFGNLPMYFEEGLMNVQWLGPILPTECDPLYDRVMDLVEARRSSASSQS